MIGQLSPTVRTEVEAVIPRLSASLNEAIKSTIEAETARGVREAVQQSVPEAIDRLLQRPMVSRQIVTALVDAASPVINQALSTAIASTLIPSMSAATETVLSSVASQLRSEMLEIRKEIVAEQSSVMSSLSTEITSLRGLVASLQTQMRDMSASARSTAYNAAPGSSRPQTANFATHSRVASGNQSFAAQPLQAQPIMAPPPAPSAAAASAAAQFEDFLLNALVSPPNGQLDSFISEDPANRITTVFPPGGRRNLSQVCLSLVVLADRPARHHRALQAARHRRGARHVPAERPAQPGAAAVAQRRLHQRRPDRSDDPGAHESRLRRALSVSRPS